MFEQVLDTFILFGFIAAIVLGSQYLNMRRRARVHETIERYKALPKDPVATGLLCLIGSTDRIIHSFKVKGGIAVGFDEAGKEIVRVPVTESIFERAAFDAKLGTIRNNTP